MNLSFSTVANEWMQHYSYCVKDVTLQGHKEKVRRLKQFFGDIDIKDIDYLTIQKLISNLYLQNFAKDTIKKYKGTLSMILDFAIIKQYIDNNYSTRIKIPKNAPVGTRETLTKNEIKKVVQNVNQHQLGIYAIFLLFTGMRRSEALAIKWSDIDFENNLISVNKFLFFDKNEPQISPKLKNGDKERKIPIVRPLRNHLRLKEGKGFIFLDGSDNLYTKNLISSRWRSYRKFTGMNVTQHQFRHTYATLLFQAGVDIKVIQHLMGHKTLSQTLNVYTHIDNEHKQKSIEVLQNYFDFIK